MSKVKECPACTKEVAKSAKVCPHCGKTLKTGLFVKLLTVLIVLGVLGAIFGPSNEEKAQKLSEKLDGIANAEVANISPSGEISEMFNMLSKNTDIQRDNMENKIKGKIVQWSLPVYEINKLDENKYRIQTDASARYVGAFLTLHSRTSEERAYIESLQTGNIISFKGKIKGTTMRYIDIDPVVLM